jgi:hypothetical protein
MRTGRSASAEGPVATGQPSGIFGHRRAPERPARTWRAAAWNRRSAGWTTQRKTNAGSARCFGGLIRYGFFLSLALTIRQYGRHVARALAGLDSEDETGDRFPSFWQRAIPDPPPDLFRLRVATFDRSAAERSPTIRSKVYDRGCETMCTCDG